VAAKRLWTGAVAATTVAGQQVVAALGVDKTFILAAITIII
jgi:hypothetical protein